MFFNNKNKTIRKAQALMATLLAVFVSGQSLAQNLYVTANQPNRVMQIDTTTGEVLSTQYGASDIEGLAPPVFAGTQLTVGNERNASITGNIFDAAHYPIAGDGRNYAGLDRSCVKGSLLGYGGALINIQDGNDCSAGRGSTVSAWSPQTGERLPFFGLPQIQIFDEDGNVIDSGDGNDLFESDRQGGAIDPTTGHAAWLRGRGGSFIEFWDLEAGTFVEQIETDISSLQALTFNGDGTLYAVTDNGDESLYIIDRETGVSSVVGVGGDQPYKITGLAYSQADEKLYGSVSNGGSGGAYRGIVEIDPTTGVASQLPIAPVGVLQALTTFEDELWTWVGEASPTSGEIGFPARVSLENMRIELASGVPVPPVLGLVNTPYAGVFWSSGLDELTYIDEDANGIVYSAATGLPVSAVRPGISNSQKGDINPVDGYLYAVEESNDGDILVWNVANDTLVRTLASGITNLEAITFANDGTLYGVPFISQTLYTIDTTSGASTVVGVSGATGYNLIGLEYLNSTDTLYGVTDITNGVDSSRLVEIDTASGVATLATIPRSIDLYDLTSDAAGRLWALTQIDSSREGIRSPSNQSVFPVLVDLEDGGFEYTDGRLVVDNDNDDWDDRQTVWIDDNGGNPIFKILNYQTDWSASISLQTGEFTEVRDLVNVNTRSGGIDPNSPSELYAINLTGDNITVRTIADLTTVTREFNSTLTRVSGLTFGPNGNLYTVAGYANNNDVNPNAPALYILDKSTADGTSATPTLVGQLTASQLSPNDIGHFEVGGITYLPNEGVFLATTSGDDLNYIGRNDVLESRFITIDPATAEVTILDIGFVGGVHNLATDAQGRPWVWVRGDDRETGIRGYPALVDLENRRLTRIDGSPAAPFCELTDRGERGLSINTDGVEALASFPERGEIFYSNGAEAVCKASVSTPSDAESLPFDLRCRNIEAMAVDRATATLYSTCDLPRPNEFDPGFDDLSVSERAHYKEGIYAIDLDTGDYELWLDTDQSKAICPDQDDSTVQETNPGFEACIDVDDSGLAVDADGGFMYLTEESGEIWKINMSTKRPQLLVDLEYVDHTSEVGSTFVDAFIGDPAVSLDSDGDGLADRIDDGYTQNDTTVGVDVSPYDASNGVVFGISNRDSESWRIVSQLSQMEVQDIPSGLELIGPNTQACVQAIDEGAPGRVMDVTLTYFDNYDYSRMCSATWLARDAEGNPLNYEDVICDFVVFNGKPSVRATVSLMDGGPSDLDGVANNQICFSMTPTFPVPVASNPDNVQNGVELAVRPVDADRWEVETVVSADDPSTVLSGYEAIGSNTDACLVAADGGLPQQRVGITLTYTSNYDYDRICKADWMIRGSNGDIAVSSEFCDYVNVDGGPGARAHLTFTDGGLNDTDGDVNDRICFSVTPAFGNSDSDALLDDEDSCPNTPLEEISFIDEFGCGPSERDTDGDGIFDGEDLCPNTIEDDLLLVGDDGCSPNERDTDGDGVIDIEDAFPTDPSESVDSDGDGFGDNEELEQGTDPNDPNDIPRRRGLPPWLIRAA